MPWQAKAAAKRASVLAKIPPEWRLSEADLDRASKQRDLTGAFIEQFLTVEEIAIISQASVSLVAQIREGKYSAVQVTRAFCKTAAIAHQIVSEFDSSTSILRADDWQNPCLHEIFFDQALDRAKELDEYFATHGTTTGPLHGLPISLKDQFHVKGNDTTMGYVGWIGTYEGRQDPSLVHNVNSQVVSELLGLGAVLYCKVCPGSSMTAADANVLVRRVLLRRCW